MSSSERNWLATVRGRAGIAVDQALFYATAGIAFAGVHNTFCYYSDCDASQYNAKSDSSKVGFAGGAGVEFAVDDQMTLDFSYLFVGLPTTKTHRVGTGGSPGDPINFDSSANLI
jgi:outer membrane immunogenic protein